MKKILLSIFLQWQFFCQVMLKGKTITYCQEMTTYVSTNLKLDATTTASLEKS
ncbi:MAG: hypothetical protein IPQ19_09445 [Bacteroidetes bacterium]|nr:hypothetical protein [Bacteroidota bacterium]